MFWILCFEFVSDFVLRISDLSGVIVFINSETPHYLPAGAAPAAGTSLIQTVIAALPLFAQA